MKIKRIISNYSSGPGGHGWIQQTTSSAWRPTGFVRRNFRLIRSLFLGLAFASASWASSAADSEPPQITFNKAFEGGSLGKIEKLAGETFRCFVEGQHDERGRNRQANWYYFRMDHVKDRDLTVTLTDVVGEYNDRPGACPMSEDIVPVFSYDNSHWENFTDMKWDNQKKEATLRIRPSSDSIWIAHVPPYTTSRLNHLLTELRPSPHARVEVIGRTVLGRDLHVVTVTNFEKPDAGKKTVWLIARQHAWEAGTSFVMEGALRFAVSNNPNAGRLRDAIVFKFTPMMDPDGCASGKVRFNANGFDVNRHWDEVDLRTKETLERMPEIWYVKKSIFSYVDSGRKIDFALNLHNTESTEYLATQADDPASQKMLRKFFDNLVATTSFDPAREPSIEKSPLSTTCWLYKEKGIPFALMEQRIGLSKKLSRRLTIDDRLAFGRALIAKMAEVVLP